MKLTPETVRLYIKQGKLTPVRFGRAIRLEDAELQRFIVDSRQGAAA